MFVALDYISAFSILAPVVVGAIFYSRLFSFAQLLYWFVVFTLCCEVLAAVLFSYQMNNMFVFHLFSFGEVTFICLIYYNLSDNEVFRKLITTGFILFQTFSLINLLFFDDITHFNSVQRYFEMAIIYTLLSAFIVRAVREDNKAPLVRDPAVILTFGFMAYYLFTLFLFVEGDKIFASGDDTEWIIHGISNILLNGVYTIVLFRAKLTLN